MTVVQVYIVDTYLFNRYNQRRDSMIIGFKDKETEKIYHQSFSKRLPGGIMKSSIVRQACKMRNFNNAIF